MAGVEIVTSDDIESKVLRVHGPDFPVDWKVYAGISRLTRQVHGGSERSQAVTNRQEEG